MHPWGGNLGNFHLRFRPVGKLRFFPVAKSVPFKTNNMLLSANGRYMFHKSMLGLEVAHNVDPGLVPPLFNNMGVWAPLKAGTPLGFINPDIAPLLGCLRAGHDLFELGTSNMIVGHHDMITHCCGFP